MIKSIKAKQILDSRGKATVEVKLETADGFFVASVPSGTSEGKYEAREVKAQKAVFNINKIIGPRIIGRDPREQKEIDCSLPKKMGANAVLAVSIAICRAGAAVLKMPLYRYIQKLSRGPSSAKLPKTCVLLIEGGLHSRRLGKKLDFQEFMAVAGFEQTKKVYQKLAKILKTGTGLEGGFAPEIFEPEQALNLIMKAVGDNKIGLGLDCAASYWSLSSGRKYNLDFYQDLVKKYPIIFLEDPFSEDDWPNWRKITEKLGKKIIIVGDDLLTTNVKRIKEAKKKKACNGMIVKPDQVGTITETLEAVRLAKSSGWKIIVSHRSGETRDDFIADLAVGIGADFIKSGGPFQPERLVKYEHLLTIEKELSKIQH